MVPQVRRTASLTPGSADGLTLGEPLNTSPTHAMRATAGTPRVLVSARCCRTEPPDATVAAIVGRTPIVDAP